MNSSLAAAETRDRSADQVGQVRLAFESRLHAGEEPSIEGFADHLGPAARPLVVLELIIAEIEWRRGRGEQPRTADYIDRFPSLRDFLERKLDRRIDSEGTVGSTLISPSGSEHDPAAPTSLKAGDLLGRYQLLSPLGRGGMGEVWRARDDVLERDVALKTVRSDRTASPGRIAALIQEGKKLGRLNHDWIVSVLDAGFERDRLYLVSELMSGGTLEQRITAAEVSLEQKVRWIRDIAVALQAAHARGFIHRDIKPSNILFDEHHQPHVSDFGLAASEEDQKRESPGTLGTFAYMPPEQVRGDSHLADPRSDVYSIGVMLYRALTGRLPFTARTPAEYKTEILHREPRPPRSLRGDVPVELEQICLACLRKDMAGRTSSALALAESLDHWLKASGAAPPRRVWPWVAAATVLLIGVALAAPSVWPRRANEAAPGIPATAPPAVQNLAAGQARIANPQVICWQPRDERTDQYHYNAERGVFQFDAYGHALFQVGEAEQDVVDLELAFQLAEGVGTAGVFWGLTAADDAAYRCWAVTVGRSTAGQPPMISICEYLIDPILGRIQVRGVTRLKRLPVPEGLPTTRLHVRANSQNVLEIKLNGKPFLTTAFSLTPNGAHRIAGTGFGFTGHQGRVGVSSLAILEH